MFRRGQRIIIKESSVSGKSHPAKGDMGYLNNMYFFYKARLILMDAYFFAYKSDVKKKSVRCEKKKFIIDIGMSKRFKRRLKLVGMKRSWFVNNEYMANLAGAGHWPKGGVRTLGVIDNPSIHGFYGIWPTGALNSSPLKIPFGQIAIAPGRYTLQGRPKEEIKCWTRCIYPLLNTQLVYFRHQGDNSIQEMISGIYRKHCPGIHGSEVGDGLIFKFLNKPMSTKATVILIEGLKQIQVLSGIYLGGLDEKAIKELSSNPNSNRIAAAWLHRGLLGLIEGDEVPKYYMQILISTFIKSVLFDDNVEKQLLSIRKYLPWSDKKIHSLTVGLSKIRRGVDNDSAALARIYEESLFD